MAAIIKLSFFKYNIYPLSQCHQFQIIMAKIAHNCVVLGGNIFRINTIITCSRELLRPLGHFLGEGDFTDKR